MRKPRPLITQKQALIVLQLCEGVTKPWDIKDVVKPFTHNPQYQEGAKAWTPVDVVGSLLYALKLKGYAYSTGKGKDKQWRATELGAWTAINYFTP